MNILPRSRRRAYSSATECDRIAEWRQRQRANSPRARRARRARAEMEAIEASAKQRAEIIKGALILILIILIFALLPSCEVHTYRGNGKSRTQIVPPWQLDGGLLNPFSWAESIKFKLTPDKHPR